MFTHFVIILPTGRNTISVQFWLKAWICGAVAFVIVSMGKKLSIRFTKLFITATITIWLEHVSMFNKLIGHYFIVMCDTYRTSTFSFNIMIQYWLLCVSIHCCGQSSKPGFSHLSNFISKGNYEQAVCA